MTTAYALSLPFGLVLNQVFTVFFNEFHSWF